MNPVSQVIRAEDVALDVEPNGKDALLGDVATLLARRTGLPQAQINEALVLRERLGSTALGHGVAIPHARMPQCVVEAGIFIRTKAPVAFDAPDGRPVSLFLALLVPKLASDRHLKLLATAAAMFGDKAFRDRLRVARDSAEVVALLESWSP